MSFNLWRFFLEDDVDSFRQYLACATFDRSATKTISHASGTSLKIGSPGTLSTSPKTPVKPKRGGNTPGSNTRGGGPVLTRSDVNGKDALGRTLLHHVASSRNASAVEFIKAMLDIPFLDLYAQDTESGWTALHRALYFGNVTIAQALMVKDIQNAIDYTTSSTHAHAGGLVKIKDHEGNSPFEVFASTIAPRILQNEALGLLDSGDADSAVSVDMNEDGGAGDRNKRQVQPSIDLQADELFAFGSNRNLTLGTGDEDDRHYPERIQLKRPEHLQWYLYRHHLEERRKQAPGEEIPVSSDDTIELPAMVVNKPIGIQNVVMSKLHTAILTDDPISNLHICGFGPGGRLGTGDEATRFNYVCIQAGGISKRRVAAIALGQDHSVAVCTTGEVFTWGSNKYGQLGYELPDATSKEVPAQLIPRQIYGLIKKEQVIGACASSLHSAIFTASALYTFGKNEGQLGLMDADARSLEMQIVPRRIGVSIIQSTIQSVSAIDRSTVVLLENHDVIVFTHYGWTKVIFPLEGFASQSMSNVLTTRYNMETNYIQNIATGGNTICARSSYGEVFTIDVPRLTEAVPSNKSTTHPTKARNSLPLPVRVWSIRKTHMAAIDAAVGQDGSIVLCTLSGTVWKKEKRANIKSVHQGSNPATKTKDYKFVRIPNITRAIAVRSNAFGAFIAVRKDSDVAREQILVQPPTLWADMFPLLCFHDYGNDSNENEDSIETAPRFWTPRTKGPCTALIKKALMTREDAEQEILSFMQRLGSPPSLGYDTWVTSDATDVRLPVHSFILKGRSHVLRRAMAEFQDTYYFSIPEVLSIEYGADGLTQLSFQGADFLTIASFVLYVYTDAIADVWRNTSKALHLAPRYRLVRQELMKIASSLELQQLERAARVMFDPTPSMRSDFETAFLDSEFYSDADVVIDLADGQERYAHTRLLCSRCPFFEGLFHGRTGGMWMANRRRGKEGAQELTRVDLKHIQSEIFELVLRHIYADTGEELFDEVTAKDLDSFIDVVIDVMSIANELMLDRLAQICQHLIGKFINTRNICGLLNTIAESSVNEFKQAALEYLCLNLESMLEQRFLEELDDYLLEELDDVVRQNQLAFMPFARSGRATETLIEQYPELIEGLERSKQRRLDSMRLRSHLVNDEARPTVKPKFKSEEDLPFSMDEDGTSTIFTTREDYDKSPSTGSKTWDIRRPSLTRLSSSDGLVDNLSNHEAETPSSSLAATPKLQMDTRSYDGTDGQRNQPKLGWSGSLPRAEKMDFKHIMAQASSTQVSDLTQSLQAAAQTANKTTPKLSQKERKRQQQQARLNSDTASPVVTSVSNLSDTAITSPTSPWQNVSQPSVKLSTTFTPQPETISKSRAPIPARSDSRHNVEDRIASSSISQGPMSNLASRGQSKTGEPAKSAVATPQIQSIRHIPLSSRSSSAIDARTSMADILAQQQTEKSAIREAVAKRSLQEIQQEQEFQEWWDQESRRVQEEEAAVASTSRREKTGRGRGRGANPRKSSGRGLKTNEKQQASAGASGSLEGSKFTESKASRGSSSVRGGQPRGRGRGSAQHSRSTA